jgi:twitching motility protein PilJ
MVSTPNYDREYQQAEAAYSQGDYQKAAGIIDKLLPACAEDSNTRLLRGHIYCYGLQQYEVGRQEYEAVLKIARDPQSLQYARDGIDYAQSNIGGDSGGHQPEKLPQDQSELEMLTWQQPELLTIDDEFDLAAAKLGIENDDVFEQRSTDFGSSLGQKKPTATNFHANEQETLTDAFAFDYPSGEPATEAFISNPFEDIPVEPNISEDSKPSLDQAPDLSADESSIFNNENDTLMTGNGQAAPSDLWNAEDDDAPENTSDFISGFLEYEAPKGSNKALNSSLLESLQEGIKPERSGFMAVKGTPELSGSLSPEELRQAVPISGNISPPTNFDLTSTFINSSPGLAAKGVDNLVVGGREEVSTENGPLAEFRHPSLAKSPWVLGAIGGGVAAGAVLVVAIGTMIASPKDLKPSPLMAGSLALVAGLSACGATAVMGRRYNRAVEETIVDLQSTFDQVSQNNLKARATVSSGGELGRLSASFNHMLQSVVASNSEAQRKAREMEQAKDELQRQVIRLLDDVEGAARGDLTVKAEVTADVLGAVADSFNLTIDSLRQIVQQVQTAAVQVNNSSTESEAFARRLSSDALRQAEELAVTVNSVQMMTASIKRVAESARDSEEVARTASATALKGGEAVERTVAGILEIRETVAESTRKVKRLAESSQQISQIVSVISQIASRTNLLALNASIEEQVKPVKVSQS